MRIEAGVPCVNFDDFLRLTLPINIRHVDTITVITAPGDAETVAVAKAHGAAVIETDAFTEGGVFNKARALNVWLDSIDGRDPDVWVLALDADILLPAAIASAFADANPTDLYGAPRRLCVTEEEWESYTQGLRDLQSFPVLAPPVVEGRVWNLVPTSNAAGLCGYFQAWNLAQASGMPRFPEAPTAAGYDVVFGLSFDEQSRHYLDGVEVLHLGPPRVNWVGRQSVRWGEAV
jgi:hypothetical protein